MASEISLQQEGAKIAREAEHAATFHAAQAELSADLKKMTPGNYAEVLRQVLDTNRVDVRSNPTLPDLYLSHSSKSALMPDLLSAKPPSQGEVAERIFLPPTKSPYANISHVALAPGQGPSLDVPSGHSKGVSDRMAPSGAVSTGAVRREARPTKPENVAASVVELVIDKVLGSTTPKLHMSAPINNPYLKK